MPSDLVRLDGEMARNSYKFLPREFYNVKPEALAKRLLNKVLIVRGVSGRIVETEAYAGEADAASHAYKGETARTAVMFGKPGLLYVYFTYGMHFCCNVVAQSEGTAAAVLIRALSPLDGLDVMRERRSTQGTLTIDRQLTSGPAKLCQALSINRSDNGADIVEGERGIHIVDDGTPFPRKPGVGPRIGIKQATDKQWRFWVEGNENVSR